MKVIGFANKFYTLWEVTEDTRSLGNGHSYVITHYVFVKNISFDKETAIKKYPDAPIDETLRGKTVSWESKKEVWDNVDTFRFGKYQYMKIEKVNDIKYIAWYWGQVYGEHKDFVSKFLKKNGYEIRTRTWKTYEGFDRTDEYLVSPEALANEKAEAEKLVEDENILKAGNPLSFFCEYNLDENGEVRDDNLTYKFPETKEMEYRGWPYWLPIKDGKAKRIKNKNITVTKYTYEENDYGFTVNVIDFEIVK
jgi:hypothetical protein